MRVIDPIEPTQDDQEFAEKAMRRFSSLGHLSPLKGTAEFVMQDRDMPVVVPAHIAELFRQILVQVANGNAVTIVPYNKMLSTQDAADLLNVSRPFAIKLLEQEKVSIQRVGNRRRVAFSEVMKLREKLRERSEEAFNKMAELDQELGIES